MKNETVVIMPMVGDTSCDSGSGYESDDDDTEPDEIANADEEANTGKGVSLAIGGTFLAAYAVFLFCL